MTTTSTPTPSDLVPYVAQQWVDVPTGTTAPPGALREDAESFNHMESGITRAHLIAAAAWNAVDGSQTYDGGQL